MLSLLLCSPTAPNMVSSICPGQKLVDSSSFMSSFHLLINFLSKCFSIIDAGAGSTFAKYLKDAVIYV